MAQNTISGAETTASMAFEDPDNWGNSPETHTASDETYVPFGQGIDISVARSNEAERIYGIGNRNATATINKNYTGTLTVNGSMTNVWWLLGVLGANTDGGSVGAYTHTYTETNILPSSKYKFAIINYHILRRT